MDRKNTRGGARSGAGRKRLPLAERKKTVAFRLRVELIDRMLAAAKERHQTPTELLTELLENELS